MQFIQKYFEALWSLTLEMAPWLLLGFLFAGLLKVFYPQKSLEKHMGKNNLKSILNATFIGIPLPLCSCGVIPTGISFFRNGASRPATNAFLISTPQTGIDSIFATYALMGLPFAIIRPVIAFFTGIMGGIVTAFFAKSENKKVITEKPSETCDDGTCSCENVPAPPKHKWAQALHYGFVEMMMDIAKWLVIGLLIAALITALIPDDFFQNYIGNFWVELLIVLAISIPLYVCATGSIPIATALLLKGLSPATAILFLMAGPATNVVTMTVIGKTMGKRSLMAYLGSIIGGAILFAILIHFFIRDDLFLDYLPIGMHHSHSVFPEWLSIGMAILLIGLILNSFYLRYFKTQINMENTPHNTQIFTVQGMTCNHCTASVERNVGKIENVKSVHANLGSGKVTVEGDASEEEIKKIIQEIGYEVIT